MTENDPKFNRWISKETLRVLLGLRTVRTIEKWMALGMPHRKFGRLVRFDYEEVLRWHDQRS
jgi:phage terminase Nu1 subunit (DNA packaging protein)